MASKAIVTSWGLNVQGREHMGMQLFMSAVAWFMELKGKGEIEELRIYMADNGSLHDTAGHMVVEGSDEQIAALAARDDYQKLIMKAAHVVQTMSTATYAAGDAVMRRIEMLQVARKELGI